MADPPRDDEPAFFELGEFALRRSGAGARVPDELRRVETPLGLAEKHMEHALLCLRQQGVCQALSPETTCSRGRTQVGYNHALSGHDESRPQYDSHIRLKAKRDALEALDARREQEDRSPTAA